MSYLPLHECLVMGVSSLILARRPNIGSVVKRITGRGCLSPSLPLRLTSLLLLLFVVLLSVVLFVPITLFSLLVPSPSLLGCLVTRCNRALSFI